VQTSVGSSVWIAEPRWTLGSFQCVDGDGLKVLSRIRGVDQSCDFCSGNDGMGFEKEIDGVTVLIECPVTWLC